MTDRLSKEQYLENVRVATRSLQRVRDALLSAPVMLSGRDSGLEGLRGELADLQTFEYSQALEDLGTVDTVLRAGLPDHLRKVEDMKPPMLGCYETIRKTIDPCGNVARTICGLPPLGVLINANDAARASDAAKVLSRQLAQVGNVIEGEAV